MKVCLYARVSTEQQEKDNTIRSQLEQLEEFARKNRYDVVETYIDEGWSGEVLARPGLDRLRDDANKGIFETVLITCPDRLARKFIYQGIVLEELERKGIRIIFLNQPSIKTDEDKLLLGMQGLIAEYEKAKIKERTRRGKLSKAKNGYVVGGVSPYGYRYIRKAHGGKGHYEINQTEAEVVRTIFDLCVNDQMSIRGITKELAKRGIRGRKGNPLTKGTIARILKNETYAGITYYNKHIQVESSANSSEKHYKRRKKTSMRIRPKNEWIPIKVPSIIDRNMWETAQNQLQRNSRFSTRNANHNYLLQGLIRCSNCGSPYYGIPYHGRYFYRCGNKYNVFPLPRTCKNGSISTERIEPLIWDTVCEIIQQPQIVASQIIQRQKRKERQREYMEEQITTVKKNIANISKKEDRILDAYRDGLIDRDQLRNQMLKIREEKERLIEKQQQIKVKHQYAEECEDAITNIKLWCDKISGALKNFTLDEKKKLLRLLIKKIILDTETQRVRIQGILPIYPEPQKSLIESTTSL
ncbi:MAG: recombinase family protein [bacterium]|nr:recombinase family protein [bacterium]